MDTDDEKKQEFLAHLENLLLNRRKITRQQVAAWLLYARLNGWITHREQYQTKDEQRPARPAQEDRKSKYGLEAYKLPNPAEKGP